MRNSKLTHGQLAMVGENLAEEFNLVYWSYEIRKDERKNKYDVWYKCYNRDEDEYNYIVRSYEDVKRISKMLYK